jgi:hemerythrin-like domain-containing protein
MIKLMQRERESMSRDAKADTHFIEHAVDFIRTYADKCHHGKEEDILFRQLMDKKISPEHFQILEDLVKEHAHGRNVTRSLAEANERYASGDEAALSDIGALLDVLIEFYPRHIEKEDKLFFIPCMEYFTDEEQQRMLDKFNEFDRNLIHETYKKLVEGYE